MFAEAASVLSDVNSELVSTYPLTFAPGEFASGYRITVRLGIFVTFTFPFWLCDGLFIGDWCNPVSAHSL
jgi:hypothetical protein